jgi:hypothetical protein
MDHQAWTSAAPSALPFLPKHPPPVPLFAAATQQHPTTAAFSFAHPLGHSPAAAPAALPHGRASTAPAAPVGSAQHVVDENHDGEHVAPSLGAPVAGASAHTLHPLIKNQRDVVADNGTAPATAPLSPPALDRHPAPAAETKARASMSPRDEGKDHGREWDGKRALEVGDLIIAVPLREAHVSTTECDVLQPTFTCVLTRDVHQHARSLVCSHDTSINMPVHLCAHTTRPSTPFEPLSPCSPRAIYE